MTPEEVKAARERAEKATPGPWNNQSIGGRCFLDHVHGRGDCDYRVHIYGTGTDISNRVFVEGEPHDHGAVDETLVAGMWDYEAGGIRKEEDAVFIAHARADVPALCDALDEARAEIDVRIENIKGYAVRVTELERERDELHRRLMEIADEPS